MDLYKLFYNKNRVLILILTLTVLLSGCSQLEQMGILETSETASYSLSEIPPYENSPYVVLEDNMPAFSEADMSTESFETYSDLDRLGRCGVAFANVGRDLMPTEKRGSIGMVKPSGWQLAKYDIVDGKYLYNRCHLLGYQLTGENANEKNLITGTRYMNVDGMLPFEDMVADYVKETGGHVLYRVTPIYDGNDLVARGVQMEGYSVEDDGEGVCFNVFVYNVQPGIEIDYSNGDNRLDLNNAAAQDDEEEKIVEEIRGNKRSKIYHCPGQRAYGEMEDSKNLIIFDSEEEAIEAGYRKAKQ
ncbi:DNA/RNA non-specific endonuclease [Emergencia sp. 1XD21-10]|uniref:DNA/RNA non-specific endonuclease n=1 Tax=Emergencia sp. 1XD21-10 TaxID=2304569 RepID=UPI001379AE4D|nr:DNA/RNA non-specific endonuclease [Emergencia sp. 1XD21-10]NCE97844.1 hypothetical protein [Emergencia sp. 1XD21-10]